MSFLNPFFLFGSLALAIPVLIHLVRREKSEIVPFSSLMFLLKVPKRAIRQQKIKNLLLMALRLLILALLVTAFARPYITAPSDPAAAGGANRGIVLLLDNSYSMRYGTNFERMKDEAGRRIDAMTGSDKMAIISFNDKSALLTQQPTTDKQTLKAALSVLEPSSAGTRFYDAFSLADRAFTLLGTAQKQLIVISDFQRVGWNRSSRESVLGNDVKTEVVNLAVENPMNVGIDTVRVDATSFTRIYAGRVIASIHNYRKDQPAVVPVSLNIGGKEAARKTVTVSANATAIAEFTGFDLDLGFSKGVVKIETDDSLPIDNQFSFVLNRREKLVVLIIDTGKARPSQYLHQALTSSEELPFNVRVVSAGSVTPDDVAKSEVVVVNDVPSLSDAVRKSMNEKRKGGQGQFVILGTNADLDWWNGMEGFPVKATQKIFVANDRGQSFYSLTSYDRNHPIFQPFEKTAIALNTAQFYSYVQVEAKPGAAVLAKFEDGAPILTESSPDDRGLVVFNSAVDNVANDLPLKPSFLPMFHEIIRYLSRYSDVRGSYPLGEGVPVVGGVESASAAVIDPDGERVALGDLTPGQQRFFTPEKPGFHELRVGPELRLFAVNPPSAESNLYPMVPEDLLASVQRTQGEAQQAGFFGQAEEDEYARRQNGWWYFLLFALMAGIAEIYVANRAYNKAQ